MVDDPELMPGEGQITYPFVVFRTCGKVFLCPNNAGPKNRQEAEEHEGVGHRGWESAEGRILQRRDPEGATLG